METKLIVRAPALSDVCLPDDGGYEEFCLEYLAAYLSTWPMLLDETSLSTCKTSGWLRRTVTP